MNRTTRFTTAVVAACVLILAACGSSGSTTATATTQAKPAVADVAALKTWMTDHEPDAESSYLDIADLVLKDWPTQGNQACATVLSYFATQAGPTIPPIPDPGLEARFQAAIARQRSHLETCSRPDATRDDAVKLRSDYVAINGVLRDALIASSGG